MAVTVAPNPMHETSVISYQNLGGVGKLQLNLYNALGQLVATQQALDNQFIIQRNGLPNGCYFYKIQDAKGNAAQGKLLME